MNPEFFRTEVWQLSHDYPAEDTVFINDNLQNLKGASDLGITPILIASNPVSNIEVPFLTIHSLIEVLK